MQTYALYNNVISVSKKEGGGGNRKFPVRPISPREQTAGPAAGDKNRSLAHTQNYYWGAGQAPKETRMVFKIASRKYHSN